MWAFCGARYPVISEDVYNPANRKPEIDLTHSRHTGSALMYVIGWHVSRTQVTASLRASGRAGLRAPRTSHGCTVHRCARMQPGLRMACRIQENSVSTQAQDLTGTTPCPHGHWRQHPGGQVDHKHTHCLSVNVQPPRHPEEGHAQHQRAVAQ